MLCKWYGVVRDKVLELMNTDLIRHRPKWLGTVKDIRSVFTRLESDGFSKETQRAWQQHWDHQIYKALNTQYSKGLISINEVLPEVKLVEGIFEIFCKCEYIAVPNLLKPIKAENSCTLSPVTGFFTNGINVGQVESTGFKGLTAPLLKY